MAAASIDVVALADVEGGPAPEGQSAMAERMKSMNVARALFVTVETQHGAIRFELLPFHEGEYRADERSEGVAVPGSLEAALDEALAAVLGGIAAPLEAEPAVPPPAAPQASPEAGPAPGESPRSGSDQPPSAMPPPPSSATHFPTLSDDFASPTAVPEPTKSNALWVATTLTGAAGFVVAYAAALITGAVLGDDLPNTARAGNIPLAGPFLAHQTLSDATLSSGGSGFLLVFNGIVQVLGFAAAVLGGTMWILGSRESAASTPAAAAAAGGLGAWELRW